MANSIDFAVMIGGEAGQGIQTVGQLLADACSQSGFFIFGVNDFESRIRGGHSFVNLRIGSLPFHAPRPDIHLLVAMDQRTRDLHQDELFANGLILLSTSQVEPQDRIIPIALDELAKQAGSGLTANTVAAGAVLAVLGAPASVVEKTVQTHFAGFSAKVLEMNLAAAQLGFQALQDVSFEWALDWSSEPASRGRLMEGSRALALGAVAADCRFGAFYPMSPATGIMAQLTDLSSRVPLVVEQAEDEIAAVNMAIGASFAGVRALTATSGGGFCLMTEGLGLAAMTETPLVVVDAQRPGPATGLPTRTAQGDLLFVIHASQDEFPRFVFAPGTPGEAYETAVRAFDLADKYQVPAIVLVDQFFNDSLFTVGEEFKIPAAITHHLVCDQDMGDPEAYRRYALTPDGISPRALPCAGRALVKCCSDEHDESGHMNEDAAGRSAMVEKRHAKWSAMGAEMRAPRVSHASAEILLVGWGSTQGAVAEAVDQLRAAGVDAGGVHVNDLWPFPAEAVRSILKAARRFFTVEQNFTAQLGQLIRQQTGLGAAGAILKYDGRPFAARQIVDDLMSQMR